MAEEDAGVELGADGVVDGGEAVAEGDGAEGVAEVDELAAGVVEDAAAVGAGDDGGFVGGEGGGLGEGGGAAGDGGGEAGGPVGGHGAPGGWVGNTYHRGRGGHRKHREEERTCFFLGGGVISGFSAWERGFWGFWDPSCGGSCYPRALPVLPPCLRAPPRATRGRMPVLSAGFWVLSRKRGKRVRPGVGICRVLSG